MCECTKKYPNMQVPWSTERQHGNQLGQKVKGKGKAGLESRVLGGGAWAGRNVYWHGLWLPRKFSWVITKVFCGFQEQ